MNFSAARCKRIALACAPGAASVAIHAVVLGVLVGPRLGGTSVRGGAGDTAASERITGEIAIEPVRAVRAPEPRASEPAREATRSPVRRAPAPLTPLRSLMDTGASDGPRPRMVTGAPRPRFGLAPAAGSERVESGPAGGGSGLFAAPAAGESGRARSVVYVVDASGAMVTTLNLVKAELLRSVNQLSRGQSFGVVMFGRRDMGADEQARRARVFPNASGRLSPATADARGEFARWLEGVSPSGRSNPLDGLRRALELSPRPDVVFLLAQSFRRASGDDGVWGATTEQILAELDRLNPVDASTGRRAVVIRTIQFLREDPTGTMQAIGREHGDGPEAYRVVTPAALGLPEDDARQEADR